MQEHEESNFSRVLPAPCQQPAEPGRVETSHSLPSASSRKAPPKAMGVSAGETPQLTQGRGFAGLGAPGSAPRS